MGLRKSPVLVICLAFTLHFFGLFEPVDRFLRDMRFSADNRAPTGDIVLIDIDAASIEKLGAWPWKRRIYGDIIDRLNTLGVSEIAFDIDFSSPSNPYDDALFAKAIERSDALVILAAFNQPKSVLSEELHGNSAISQLGDLSWPASVNVFPDPDSVIRTFPFGEEINGEPVQSIAAVLGGFSGGTDGAYLIDFGIRADLIEHIPVHDLLNGSVPAEQLNGRKVIVGASAAELRDFFAIPRFGIISGHLLQAVAAETLLQNRALLQSDNPITAGLLLLVGAGLFFLQRKVRWSQMLLACVVFALALEAGAAVLQVAYADAMRTAALHFAVFSFATLIVFREINLGKLLQVIYESRIENMRIIFDRVIADNFDGIVIVQEDGTIHNANRAALAFFSEIGTAKRFGSKTLKGIRFQLIAPEEMGVAVEQAISLMRSGGSPNGGPIVLDYRPDHDQRLVIEYVVTASWLDGGMDRSGQAKPDQVVICVSFRDITDRKIAEERLDYMARFDELTGLPNRRRFIELLDEQSEEPGPATAVLHLSVDRLQQVKDALGGDFADSILKQVVVRLRSLLCSGDVLSAIGDGEFLLFVGSLDDRAVVEELVKCTIEDVSQPYYLEGHGAAIGLTVGIAYHASGVSYDSLAKRAGIALDAARAQTGVSFSVFDDRMESRIKTRQALELDLWKAFERDQFSVYYQPQISLSSGKLIGAEALVRWIHPERGPVSPGEFIPIAEQSNLIVDLGAWILERACLEAAKWPNDLKVAVNLSPVQFMQGDVVKTVERALERSHLPVSRLDLEITESLFVEDSDHILSLMQQIKDMGLRFALDDFGTGYSSLGYIQSFPIDKIKIDQSFVRGIGLDSQSLAIIRSVATLATDLNMETVAEGIETPEQQALLHLAGCTYGQGYLYGKPMPTADWERLIGQFEPVKAPLIAVS